VAVAIDIALPGQTAVDAIAVPVAQPLSGEGARIVDDRLGGRLERLVSTGELRGERGEALLLHTNGELQAPRVVAAGLGGRESADADAFRTAGAVAAQALARVGGSVCWLLDESLPLPLADQARALVEGTVLGGYSPGQWKTEDADKRPRPIERVVLGHFETPGLRDAAGD
jgi:leucyl aminopeptidase